jgi:flagellar basal body rod protein FlgF
MILFVYRLRWGFLFFIILTFVVSLQNDLFSYELEDEVNEFYLNQTLDGANSYAQQQLNTVEYTINLHTPGYIRKSLVTVRDRNKKIENSFFYKWYPGPPMETRRQYDCYLDAKGLGFFMIQIPGTIAFTRDGRFMVDSQGRLVTMAGQYPVLGEDGIITLPEGDFMVSSSGVIYVNGKIVQRLKIAIFASLEQLNKLTSPNGVIFIADDLPVFKNSTEGYKIDQGFLESASVTRAYDSKWAKQAYEASINTAHQITKTLRSGSSIALP